MNEIKRLLNQCTLLSSVIINIFHGEHRRLSVVENKLNNQKSKTSCFLLRKVSIEKF